MKLTVRLLDRSKYLPMAKVEKLVEYKDVEMYSVVTGKKGIERGIKYSRRANT